MKMMSETGSWTYRLAGLWLKSQLRLPELVESPSVAPEEVDIRVEVQPPDAEGGPFFPSLVGGGNALELRVARVGRFRVEDGRRIRITPEPSATAEELRALLLGAAWAAVCYQRRRLVLHAAACRIQDRAVLLCGPSGCGKSSLLGGLAARGLVPVADDTCVLDFRPAQGPVVYPGTPRMRLWAEALARLELEDSQIGQAPSHSDKYLVPWAPADPDQSRPVLSIYLLEWGPWALEPLTGLAALEALARAAVFAPALLTRVQPLADYWKFLAQLLGSVPLFRCRRPRDWEQLPVTLNALIDHISAL